MVWAAAAWRLLVLKGAFGMAKGSGMGALGPWEGKQGASKVSAKRGCGGGPDPAMGLIQVGTWQKVPHAPWGCCCLIHCIFWISPDDKWTVWIAGPVTKISILSALFLSDYIVQSLPDSQSSLSIQWLRDQQPSHVNHITSQPQLKVSLLLSLSPRCTQIFSLPLFSFVGWRYIAPTHCLRTQPGRGQGTLSGVWS